MPIDSINERNVTEISLNNENLHSNNLLINDVAKNISKNISKAINRAGADVVKTDANGAKYTFTPYYGDGGKKMVMIQVYSSSTTSVFSSKKSIEFTNLKKYCTRYNISIPDLKYEGNPTI